MLNALGNPLERLSETIDFEMFRETLEMGLYRERLTNAGAKPYDYVLMFKILVLQRMYNLSDEQTEYQIVDRTSFRDFLGLASGYKNHAKVDAKSKLIKKAVTTSAEQHDSVPTRLLIDNDDRGQELHADSAYIGKNVKSVMRKYQMKDRVIKRSVRGKKLSKKQETINRKNSKTRVRVEHVFGYCELNLHGMFSRVVGLARNAARNTLTNLVYNVCRYEQIVRLGMN